MGEELSPKAGTMVHWQKWTSQGPTPAGDLRLKADENGWHTLRLASSCLPAEGIAFELTATYLATQEISG